MKTDLTHLDEYRVPHPITGYIQAGDTCGVFEIPHVDQWQRSQFGAHYVVICSDGKPELQSGFGSGWDHVSAHCRSVRKKTPVMHTPTWEDMEYLRSLFFEDDETVMQLSVPRTEHINIHNHVLHLWRPLECAIPMPPAVLV